MATDHRGELSASEELACRADEIAPMSPEPEVRGCAEVSAFPVGHRHAARGLRLDRPASSRSRPRPWPGWGAFSSTAKARRRTWRRRARSPPGCRPWSEDLAKDFIALVDLSRLVRRHIIEQSAASQAANGTEQPAKPAKARESGRRLFGVRRRRRGFLNPERMAGSQAAAPASAVAGRRRAHAKVRRPHRSAAASGRFS